MKIVIGIFQDREILMSLFRHPDIDCSSLQEVGPFFSKDQAQSWMAELRERIDPCRLAAVPVTDDPRKKWYGFTLEEVPLEP